MGVNFKEAFTYLFKDKSWKRKFLLLSAFAYINAMAIILWGNFLIGLPVGLFNLGFVLLLTGNLINETSPVLPEFNIKKIFKTGLKYYGVIFTFLAIYLVIAVIMLIIQLLTVGVTVIAGKVYSTPVKHFISGEMNTFLVVIILFSVIFVIANQLIELVFCENLSYKESFNIKKIFNVFKKNWGLFLLLMVLSLVAYAPAGLLYNTALIYDNKIILILVEFISVLVTVFLMFAFKNLLAQAYKQSLAKINHDEAKLETLKHRFNGFDYTVMALILLISVSLIATTFTLPMSNNSPIGKYRYQMETLKRKQASRTFNTDNNELNNSYKTDDENGKVDFGPYMKELQRKIKQNWHPPKGDESKRIVVLFTLSRDGKLLKLKINNSKNPIADAAAIKAVMKSAPFDPLPKEYKGKDVDIQFTFDYNVFYSGNYKRNNINSNLNTFPQQRPDIQILYTKEHEMVFAKHDMNPYAKKMEEKIKQNWNPSSTPKQKAAVKFQITNKGDIVNNSIVLYETSGNDAYDKEAVDAVKKSSPFGLLKQGFPYWGKSVEIEFWAKSKDVKQDEN